VQVMGHTKTICVLIGGALLFHDVITIRVGIGMSFAVLGMVGYGYFTHREKQATSAEKPSKDSFEQTEKKKAVDDETVVLLSNPASRADSAGIDVLEGVLVMLLQLSLMHPCIH
jgi:hypothetical protein